MIFVISLRKRHPRLPSESSLSHSPNSHSLALPPQLLVLQTLNQRFLFLQLLYHQTLTFQLLVLQTVFALPLIRAKSPRIW